jgi:hypothetical protein
MWECQSLFKVLVLILLDKYLEIGLLDYVFNFLTNFHIVVYSSCTTLHSHQQCTKAPNFLHLTKDILTGMR